jgi:hypothetical protein
MTVRGEVRYIPAETSLFVDEMEVLGEEVADPAGGGVEEAAQAAGRHELGCPREAVAADLSEVVRGPESPSDHASRDEHDGRPQQK